MSKRKWHSDNGLDDFWQPVCDTIFRIGMANACQSQDELRYLAGQGNSVAAVYLERMKEGQKALASVAPLNSFVLVGQRLLSLPLSRLRKFEILVREKMP